MPAVITTGFDAKQTSKQTVFQNVRYSLLRHGHRYRKKGSEKKSDPLRLAAMIQTPFSNGLYSMEQIGEQTVNRNPLKPLNSRSDGNGVEPGRCFSSQHLRRLQSSVFIAGGFLALLLLSSTAWAQGDQNHAVLIGFEAYPHLRPNTGQANDIRTLRQTLQQNCGFTQILVVDDSVSQTSDADRTEVALNYLRQARHRNPRRLVVYLSGYALPIGDDDFLLASPDTDPQASTMQGLKISSLVEVLSEFRESTRILLLLDCCRQTALDDEPVGVTNDVLLPAFAKMKSMVALTASGPGQQSYVNAADGRGLFASAVNAAFRGDASQDSGTSITVRELFQHVFVELQKTSAPLGVSQIPMVKTIGQIQQNDSILQFVEVKPQRAFVFANLERGEKSTLYLRHGEERFTVSPGQSQTIRCESVNAVEFYTGITSQGRDGWRPMYEAPTSSYEFRAVRQLNGRTAWVAGFTNSLGVRMVLVYPGTFRMGRNSQDQITFTMEQLDPETTGWPMQNELPSHTVSITQPFFIGQHEVTVGQFERFVTKAAYRSDAEQKGAKSGIYLDGKGESTGQEGVTWRSPKIRQTRNHPAVHLTWNDAKRLTGWLSLHEKANYDLPTEAQWEYAARAGSQTTYWNGNVPERLVQIANVRDATLRRAHPDWSDTLTGSDGYSDTAPVGSFRPNPFGVYDTSGNVWEWCADWYQEDYYSNSPVDDPGGPPTGEYHVYRGGCFY